MVEAPEPLLAAKLRAPTPPANPVPRPSLIHRLDAASADPRTRMVLVSAPAGAGKSTLVGAWLAGRSEPVAWLQVEGSDADPARFWSYVCHSLDAVVHGLADQVVPAVEATGGAADAVLPRLLAALDDPSTPVTLVLDDYHLVTNDAVHAGLERLVELAPPHVTIVLCTRVDPPLRLGRLRARQELEEIRAADLRFDDAEAAELLGPLVSLSAAQRVALVERTEGWAAGLVLAALSLRRVDDPAAFVERFGGSHELVADYLLDEVLGALDEDERHRLLQTSILDRLTGPLVDHVCQGDGGGAAWLADLAAANQLVIALDPTGTWFRYHHLLGDLLRLDAERTIARELPDLHARAAAWFADHDQPLRAIEHALAGGEPDAAADLLARHATALLNAGQFATLMRVLGALGEAADRHLGCTVLSGWLHLSQGHWDVARRHVEVARALGTDDSSDPVLAPLAITLELTTGDVGAALAVARAVRAHGDTGRSARLAAMVGGTFTTAGLPEEATEALDLAATLAEQEPDHFVAVVTEVFRAVGALEAGDRRGAEAHAHRALADAARFGNEHAPLVPLAHSVLARTTDDPADGVAAALLGAEEAGTSPRNLFLGYAEACAGDVLCAAGDPAGAEHLATARAIVDAAPDPGIIGTYLERAEARHRVAAAPAAAPDLVDPLTDREAAVLRYLPSGLSQREIAGELYVSLNTVKTHTSGLYRKLGVASRGQAVQRARELGLL